MLSLVGRGDEQEVRLLRALLAVGVGLTVEDVPQWVVVVSDRQGDMDLAASVHRDRGEDLVRVVADLRDRIDLTGPGQARGPRIDARDRGRDAGRYPGLVERPDLRVIAPGLHVRFHVVAG